MTNIIITNHAALRMLERTPFEEKNFPRIAAYAYAKATHCSGSRGTRIENQLTNIAQDNEGRYCKLGKMVAKLHSGYIYLFNEDKDKVYLITVIEYNEDRDRYSMKTKLKKMK